MPDIVPFTEFLEPWVQTVLPLKKLRLFKMNRWGTASSDPEWRDDRTETTSLDVADVVSSQYRNSQDHMVILDIDVPIALVPSSTPGHHHLYIQNHMSWEAYVQLLDALAAAQILEPGYVAACKSRGFTCVRLPWITKE